MTRREVLRQITKLFEERLQKKTGWGRNELLVEFKECVIECLTDELDELNPLENDESKDELKSRYLRSKRRVK